MAVECKHGQLARSCNTCELEAEVDELRARLTAAEKTIFEQSTMCDECCMRSTQKDKVNIERMAQVIKEKKTELAAAEKREAELAQGIIVNCKLCRKDGVGRLSGACEKCPTSLIEAKALENQKGK